MPKQTPAEELIALRALLRRLQAREAALTLEVEMEDKPNAPLRPGWPIRRIVSTPLH